MAPINTAKVASHRRLRFANIEEAIQEVDRIVQADQAGNLRQLGNWTPGQSLGHVAAWINYSYEGFPVKPPPWFIRVILRLMVKRYLRNGMPAGIRIPSAPTGTYATELYSTAEGAERLRTAFRRLQSNEQARYDSPAFGVMSHSERIELNLRHAELHLGFLSY